MLTSPALEYSLLLSHCTLSGLDVKSSMRIVQNLMPATLLLCRWLKHSLALAGHMCPVFLQHCLMGVAQTWWVDATLESFAWRMLKLHVFSTSVSKHHVQFEMSQPLSCVSCCSNLPISQHVSPAANIPSLSYFPVMSFCLLPS